MPTLGKSLVFSLLLVGAAGCMTHARTGKSSALSASAGAEGAAVAAGRTDRRENVIDRARRRDAVVISTRIEDNPRFHPALGTLLVIDPPSASLPGLR